MIESARVAVLDGSQPRTLRVGERAQQVVLSRLASSTRDSRSEQASGSSPRSGQRRQPPGISGTELSVPRAHATGTAPCPSGAVRSPGLPAVRPPALRPGCPQAGTQMSSTGGAWVLYRLTHSALALGLQGLCFSVPIAVLPLLTGNLAAWPSTSLPRAPWSPTPCPRTCCPAPWPCPAARGVHPRW